VDRAQHKAVERWFINKLPTYYIMVDKEFQACESIQRSFGTMVKK